MLMPISAPRFRQGSELRLGVHDALDDAEQVEGGAGDVVSPIVMSA